MRGREDFVIAYGVETTTGCLLACGGAVFLAAEGAGAVFGRVVAMTCQQGETRCLKHPPFHPPQNRSPRRNNRISEVVPSPSAD